MYSKFQRFFKPWYALFLVFQVLSYIFFSRVTLDYNLDWWTPQLWIDLSIPVVMPMVVPYILYYPLMIMPLFVPMKRTQEKLLILSLTIASLITYILSFTISVSIVSRVPLFDHDWSYLVSILQWIYTYDLNGLYFPSLHVMHSLLIGFYFWEQGSYKRIILFLSIIIGASTVFVKQHFILDSLIGVFCAIAIYYLVPYLICRSSKKSKIKKRIL